MDKIKQKPKKDKPVKKSDKDKSAMLNLDVKNFKENLKIREILRTVKMNSSMRLKAPRGSKVMQNKDFNDNEELFDEIAGNKYEEPFESPSALNPAVVLKNSHVDFNITVQVTDTSKEDDQNDENEDNQEAEIDNCEGISTPVEEFNVIHKSNSVVDVLDTDSELYQNPNTANLPESPLLTRNIKDRRRKLSLDQTILSRSEGLSHSSIDLHSVGKSPLERKSSFFRKKMDSFLKNTTEIFKRQSFQSKSQNISRRGSMSVSLQSLHENTSRNGEITKDPAIINREVQGSATSLQSLLTAERSASSFSVSQSDRLNQDAPQFQENRTSSSPALVVSQPFTDVSSHSVNSLNETLIHDAMLNRAISMSSGLDSAQMGRRKASRSNRLTWVASEGITNYFRRLSQGEKNREMQVCHSYQDFSTIPENMLCGPVTDSKGRRLSYQRAVSGEDPVTLSRYHDTSLRRKLLIPENPEADTELVQLLEEYATNGVPPLHGLTLFELDETASTYLKWTEVHTNLVEYLGPTPPELSRMEEVRQAMIRELVITEGDYIRSLKCIIELFMATAHDLQLNGFILDVETEKIFYNLPDIINANLFFWQNTIVPMLKDAKENKTPFNPELMIPGFVDFCFHFNSYESYLNTQSKALDYVKSLTSNADFIEYLTWCHGNKNCNRLQLQDFLSKPMQRLTKYPLIVRRIVENTENDAQREKLSKIEAISTEYMLYLNRLIRQRDELDAVDNLSSNIESIEIDFRDDDLERAFRSLSQVNLKAPMVNCLPDHQRMLIFQGDLRFKDSGKEHEVRAFLLTDMLLICKKNTKGPMMYKLLRPKYMVDKLVSFPKHHNRANRDFLSLLYVVLDEVGSSYTAFSLTDPGKDGNGHQVTLKIWDQKIREAKKTYDMAVFYAKYPFRELSEKESTSEPKATRGRDNAERDAMERVATMLHRTKGSSSDYECSTSMLTDTTAGVEAPGQLRSHTPTMQSLRKQITRASTGESSRLSSLVSAASCDEPQAGSSRMLTKPGVSESAIMTTQILPIKPIDDGVTSITVNIVSEPESETVDNAASQTAETLQLSPTSQRSPTPQRSPSPQRAASPQRSLTPTPQRPPTLQRSRTPQLPSLVTQQALPQKVLPARSSTGQTLRVESQTGAPRSTHSLPDLGVERPPTPLPQCHIPSASDRMYQSHQELLQKRRLAAAQPQYLSRDNRGTSCPPPSPTRASLKRGLAFSHSLKYPPLYKTGHVHSHSQQQPDLMPSPTASKVKEYPIESQQSTPEKKTIPGSTKYLLAEKMIENNDKQQDKDPDKYDDDKKDKTKENDKEKEKIQEKERKEEKDKKEARDDELKQEIIKTKAKTKAKEKEQKGNDRSKQSVKATDEQKEQIEKNEKDKMIETEPLKTEYEDKIIEKAKTLATEQEDKKYTQIKRSVSQDEIWIDIIGEEFVQYPRRFVPLPIESSSSSSASLDIKRTC